MKIELKNLGQVKKALIDNKDLTVIVGDNGSGKTLLLEAKTFILNSYSKHLHNVIKNLREKYSDYLKFDTDWTEINKFISETSKDFKKEEPRSSFKFTLQNQLDSSIRKSMNEDIAEQFKHFKKTTIEALNKEILMVENSDLDFELFDTPRIADITYIECNLIMFDPEILMLEMFDKADLFFMRVPIMLDAPSASDYLMNEETDPNIIKVKKHLYEPVIMMQDQIRNYFIGGFFTEITRNINTLFLPSERNLYMDVALAKTIKENLESRYSFSRENTKVRYSEHLFNLAYLNYKDNLNRFRRPDFENVYKVDPDLTKIFGGKLIFDEEGDIKSLVTHEGTEIKRELFSTKQNRLIPYLIIMPPVGRQYKEVIIEEPEAHLSLKGMRELLGYLKSLIEKGIKITLTTHSDVFYSHLNNFILMDDKVQSKVYELKKIGDESFLEEKEKTKYGYEIDLFTEELNELYEKTLSIQNDIDEY
ncbi:ATP-binding protein [Bacillus atrophaeus]|uniref:AAA family ATPase n=1 Tax=Bacillus atrophaeus TaxID=1452 RepID=UPI00227EC0AD|nr:AAA family ATPase [Bacillus atrophaeus]MCY8818439.1 ATP-binding protein [Bacillus atrophaeus]